MTLRAAALPHSLAAPPALNLPPTPPSVPPPQAVEAGAFKLARFAYNKLQTLVLPAAWQAEVDLASVVIRSK